jgi:hypothetical protein
MAYNADLDTNEKDWFDLCAIEKKGLIFKPTDTQSMCHTFL